MRETVRISQKFKVTAKEDVKMYKRGRVSKPRIFGPEHYSGTCRKYVYKHG